MSEKASNPEANKKAAYEQYKAQVQNMIHLVNYHPELIRDISDFQFHRKLGSGGFGEVWLALDMRTGKYCAIKELYSTTLLARHITNFIREINTQSAVKSSFIVPILGFTVEPPYCIITEYMPNGCLEQYTIQRRDNFYLSGTHLTISAIAIAAGLCDIHRKRIIHRDIKITNILLDGNRIPRISDFGIARVLPKNKKVTPCLGTPAYMPPELLTKPAIASFSCDMYSYGFLLWQMLYCKKPYHKQDIPSTVRDIQNGIRPQFYEKPNKPPPALKNLIEHLWDPDPSKRPTAEQVIDYFEKEKDKCYYRGTNSQKVQEFLKYVRKDQEKRIQQFQDTRNVKVEQITSGQFDDPTLDKAERMKLRQQMIKKAIEEKVKERLNNEDVHVYVDVDAIRLRLEAQLEESEESFYSHYVEQVEDQNPNDPEKNFQRKNHEPINDSSQLITDNEQTIAILKNPNDPLFNSTFVSLIEILTPEQVPALISLIGHVFFQNDDEKSVTTCMKGIIRLAEKSDKYIEALKSAHFFTILPLDTMKSKSLSFQFVSIIFLTAPQLITPLLFRAITSFLIDPYFTPDALQLYVVFINYLNNTKPTFVAQHVAQKKIKKAISLLNPISFNPISPNVSQNLKDDAFVSPGYLQNYEENKRLKEILSENPNIFTLFDLLLGYANKIRLQECSSLFIDILRVFIKMIPSYALRRNKQIQLILQVFAHSAFPATIAKSILLMVEFFDKNYSFPYDMVIKYQNDSNIQKAAYSLMLKHIQSQNQFVVSNRFTRCLVENAQKNSKFFNVILVLAKQSKEYAKLLLYHNKWLSYDHSTQNYNVSMLSNNDFLDQFYNSIPMISYVARLVFVILGYQELRNELAHTRGFFLFLRHLAKSSCIEVLRTISSIFLRIPITSSSINNIQNTEFLSLFKKTVVKFKDPALDHECCVILDLIARNGYAQDLNLYFDWLIEQINNTKNPKGRVEAIKVLVIFSCHSKLAKPLAHEKLFKYMDKLKVIPQLRNDAEIFLSNIQKYMDNYNG